jgi:hypothetical protein
MYDWMFLQRRFMAYSFGHDCSAFAGHSGSFGASTGQLRSLGVLVASRIAVQTGNVKSF